jgi:predicted dehydrogenase
VPPVNRVLAYASKIISHRHDPDQARQARVGTPDSVQVLTTQEDGSCGMYRFSGVVWHENSMGIALYGSEGTLIYDLLHDEIRGARRMDGGLEPMPIPESQRGGWNVEADFVAAIRGERAVTRTDFLTGVRYMQFTEAVARSSRHQVPVALPLSEFPNPSL